MQMHKMIQKGKGHACLGGGGQCSKLFPYLQAA